ncbi:MAG: hypothetical protein Q4B50_00570 [Bacillota bacterium]|nr:hypothetical protein [Bacillota bacterium]
MKNFMYFMPVFKKYFGKKRVTPANLFIFLLKQLKNRAEKTSAVPKNNGGLVYLFFMEIQANSYDFSAKSWHMPSKLENKQRSFCFFAENI